MMIRRAPIPPAAIPKRQRRKQPSDFRRSFYDEAEVENWIYARIRGERWQPSATPNPHPRLIPRRQMVERVGLSYPTIYRMEQRKLFPAPIKIVPVETWADEPVAAE